MADMSTMNRETKKRQLRRQIINSNSTNVRNIGRGEDSEAVIREANKKVRRRRRLLWLFLFLVVAVGAASWMYYQRNYKYTRYEVKWEKPINEGSLVGYEYFGNNILKYTKDGASYIDNKGKNIWTVSYEMKNPMVTVRGGYAVIADKQGNDLYICNEEGSQGNATTVLPISKAVISETGVVAVVQEDSISSYIKFFKKDGSLLDITIKTNIGNNGYPLDISISQDGTQMMCSYAYIQNGELKNRVVFYDFSEIGKNDSARLVGGFEEPFAETMAGQVHYLGVPYSCAFSGKGLTFFSSQNLASPELIKQVPVEENIESIFYSDEYAAVILRNNSGEYKSRLELYEKTGDFVMSRDFTYEYTGADIDGDLVILYNEDSCKIYNKAGVEKLDTTFDFAVSKIRRGSFPGTLVVTGPQAMKEIKLH